MVIIISDMFNLQNLISNNFTSLFLLAIIFCLTGNAQKLEVELPLYTRCWFYSTTISNINSNINGIASDNKENFYITFGDGRIISFNSQNAEKIWETELIGKIISKPLIDQGTVFIITNNPNTSSNFKKSTSLYCLSKSTGIIRWQIKLSTADKVFLYNSDDCITLIDVSGEAYSINKFDGKINWKKKFGAEISAMPFKKNNKIILGTLDQRVTVFSLINGEPIGSFGISKSAKIIMEDNSGNNLIVGDRKGILWSLNKKKKTRNWSFRLGAEISSITLTERGLLVCSFDNFVYLISEKGGNIIWKNRLAGRIAAEPQLRNNNFIITTVEDSEALVIELSSGKIVNKIILEEENFFTGESVQTKNLFVYSTKKGILGFSTQKEGCSETKK